MDGFSLSVDDAVLYSRPSIDVLFESAADVYRKRLVAVVMTGANEDGAHGIAAVKRLGGYTIVQNPVDAERSEMPRAALRAIEPDKVLSLDAIPNALAALAARREERAMSPAARRQRPDRRRPAREPAGAARGA